MTMGHFVHRAPRLRLIHALTLRPAELRGELSCDKQEQEQRQCNFTLHSIRLYIGCGEGSKGLSLERAQRLAACPKLVVLEVRVIFAVSARGVT